MNDFYSITTLNLRSGPYYEQGFRPIPGEKISMQDVDATKAAINLKKIAQKFRLSLYIEFEWRRKSPNAGKKGIIKINTK